MAELTDGIVVLWSFQNSDISGTSIYLNEAKAPLWDIAFSPDGNWLAGASEDKTVHLWNLATGNPVEAAFQISGHTDVVLAVVFSPDV